MCTLCAVFFRRGSVTFALAGVIKVTVFYISMAQLCVYTYIYIYKQHGCSYLCACEHIGELSYLRGICLNNRLLTAFVK